MREKMKNSQKAHRSPPTNSVNSYFPARTVRYGECLKNHAANVGGYALDGCREFMPCGEEGTNGQWTCAACGCHRDFHRAVVVAATGEVVSNC